MHLTWAGLTAQSSGPGTSRWLLDNEGAQARLRIAGGALVLALIAALHFWGVLGSFSKLLLWIGLYLLGSVLWLPVVQQGWLTWRVRVLLAMALEQSCYAWGMAASGEQWVAILAVPIFTSLGNGMRFGPAYGALSGGAGLGLLVLVCRDLPLWHAMPVLWLAVGASMVVIPVYGAILSSRLQRMRLDAEQRAAAWEQASKIDPLTRLANRVALMEALAHVFGTQRQAARVCTLFYVDLDGFKAVNDQAGHAAGDQVLVDVAQALRDAVRADDLVARLGGDEFAILAYGLAQADDARALADKARMALSWITVPGHPSLRIGASLGACLLPAEGMATPQDAVRVADELMLQVKRAGKGAVLVHPREAPMLARA
jgi:diguanylate cyclase (GGDEF)-like protein